jgi:molybdopterin molybdotransferase
MIGVDEALARLLEAAEVLPPVEVALDAAVGRVLAESVTADRDAPAADRSAMDGYAVRAVDGIAPGDVLTISGELRAGADPAGFRVSPGAAVKIFTGALIPDGADAVVMVELAEEDRLAGTVIIRERPELGENIRRRGEDGRSGEIVCRAGSVLRAAEIAVLASVGRARVRAVGVPSVALISTGDEIVDVASVPRSYEVRNSNALMLQASLRAMGLRAVDLGIAPDDPARIAATVSQGLRSDVLILSGGVSVGAHDLVGSALEAAGCTTLFHNVAMRPGKPILAARHDRGLVLGLPGNPVSAFTGFHAFVAPALRKRMGHPRPSPATVRATLRAPLRRRPGRLTYHLGELSWEEGRPMAAPVPSASSGDVLSLPRANAFIVTPGDPHALPAGASVDVLPWSDEAPTTP